MGNKIGYVLYLGSKKEVWHNSKQKVDIKFFRNKVVVSALLASNPNVLSKKYDEFCIDKLNKIILKNINKLKNKKVWIELEYKNRTKIYNKLEKISASAYLRKIGYEEKIDFKVGKYQKEWGVGKIEEGKKKFVLYFDLDLIKFKDLNGISIEVAHKISHIFHKEHDSKFYQTLGELKPKKQNTVDYTNFKILDLVNGTLVGNLSLFLIFISFIVIFYFTWDNLNLQIASVLN